MIRRAQLHRGVATGLSALLLAGLLGAVVHDTIEAHGICAEHGDTVHAGAGHADGAPAHGAAHGQHEVDGHASALDGSDEHDDAHAHCDVRVTTQLSNEPPIPPMAALVPIADSPDAPRLASPAPRVALYHLAPKSSPPA